MSNKNVTNNIKSGSASPSNSHDGKPLVVITGSAGRIGSTLTKALEENYNIIGIDRFEEECDIAIDFSQEDSITLGVDRLAEHSDKNIAAIIHLVAYFDFSGEPSPLYQKVNVEGTRLFLEKLQGFSVERFIYTSTMLVRKPGDPGDIIDEETPVEPQWAYPESKAKTERVIAEHHGKIPYTILQLAGLYDSETAVPTLANQIASIYERDTKSNLYAGDIHEGQALIHIEDLITLVQKTIEKRNELPKEITLLAGESEVLSYHELQQSIGKLIHGEKKWKTISLPTPIAKVGSWLENKAEPFIPDQFDQGKKPFIKPFMINLADDHYAIDISKAQRHLDWQPSHHIKTELPTLIASLKSDPSKWYQDNGLTLPEWMQASVDKHKNPEKLRLEFENAYEKAHFKNLWAPFFNIALGVWLLFSPFSLDYQSTWLEITQVISGFILSTFAFISLSPHPDYRRARWVTAAVGMWLLFAPLLFWAPTSAAYLNSTLVGVLVICFSIVVRPFPAGSYIACGTGPDIPPGWDFSPSDWFQRIPIIVLAFVGFVISYYLTAYQLGHINAVFDPFFDGATQINKNGTEEIITSSVSKAWPVPDAGLGALTYLLEILTGLIGSRARWRTMPWLVLLFGFMIVPLGAISITFIIIQPIVLDTWCALCLVAAAAMLIQIPYSFDEIIATIQFLRRRHCAGQPWMKILFTGDTDQGEKKKPIGDNFSQSPLTIFRDMVKGGVSVPYSLIICSAIGIWLMFTRVTLGTNDAMANADHLIGALVLTFTVTAYAEVMRSIRFINIFFGMALLITPFVLTDMWVPTIASLICGLVLIAASIPKGNINTHYGNWNERIV